MKTTTKRDEKTGFMQEGIWGDATFYVSADPPTWRDLPRILVGRYQPRILRVEETYDYEDEALFMNGVRAGGGPMIIVGDGQHPAVAALEQTIVDGSGKRIEEPITVLIGEEPLLAA